MKKQFLYLLIVSLLCILSHAQAQRKMEQLGRGVVAVRTSPSQVYIGWRLLGTDPENVTFNVYRGTTKLNAAPITSSTNYVDETSENGKYSVKPVVNGVEQAASVPASVASSNVQKLPLKVPASGTVVSGTVVSTYTYSPNDCSVGDLDGDGDYEVIVKWEPSNAKDNSQSGITGNVYLDGYKLDGTRLWRIDLGRNIRAGAHYTQFMVYDLDSDGKAEIACKTADGTVDGVGKVIGDANADHRNAGGYILRGPEFLTVFSGQTGAALSTVGYLPQRHPTIGDNPTPAQIRAIWGDDYGNRIDRFLAGVAYLDGQRPSLVMCRGYYTRAVLVAWDFRNGQLTQRWTFDSDDGTPGNNLYRGQGNHNLSVGDVDGDGKDEIMYGSCAIDDNGKGLFRTGLGHGDALHMSDMDPDRPGLEAYQPHEDQGSYGPNAFDLRDAATGALIFGGPGPNQGDNGRGMAADIDPRYKGYEVWSARGGLYTIKGQQIGTVKPSINFGVWWDGDLSRELLDGTVIDKWDYANNRATRLVTANTLGAASGNSTKANPCLSVDLFGDWREEVIWRNANNQELLIFTTTTPTAENTPRIYTLMHDPQYRLAIAWQNVGYNQPPHPGFYLGTDMNAPPKPDIALVTRPLEMLDPTYDCATGKLTFRTSGGDGSAVEYFAVGVTAWSTTADYTIEPWLRQEGQTLELKARQNGVEVTRSFKLTNCPTTNTAPYKNEGIANQIANENQPFTYETPITAFADQEDNRSTLRFSLVGLPQGMTYNEASRIISGTPMQAGSFTLTLSATDPAGLSGSLTFELTVNPASIGGPLALIEPVYNCGTGKLTFRTTGGDGSIVEYMAVGLTAWTTNPTHVVDAWLRQEGQTLELKARQNGVVVSRNFTLTNCPVGNTAPYVTGSVPNQTAGQNQPFTYEVPISTFADQEDSRGSLTYAVNGLPPGLTFDSATRLIAGTLPSTGSFVITVTATDPGGLSASTSFQLMVNSGGREGIKSYEEPRAAWKATVYPNPVGDEVTVGIEGAQGQTVRMLLTDTNGRPVVNYAVEVTTSRHQERVQVGHRPSGLYLLRVSTPKQVQTLKVIKR